MEEDWWKGRSMLGGHRAAPWTTDQRAKVHCDVHCLRGGHGRDFVFKTNRIHYAETECDSRTENTIIQFARLVVEFPTQNAMPDILNVCSMYLHSDKIVIYSMPYAVLAFIRTMRFNYVFIGRLLITENEVRSWGAFVFRFILIIFESKFSPFQIYICEFSCLKFSNIRSTSFYVGHPRSTITCTLPAHLPAHKLFKRITNGDKSF